MKKIYTIASALSLMVMASCTPSTPAQVEKIAIAGSFWDSIAIVDKASGEIEWSYGLPAGAECNSIEVTPKGDILISYKKGARLIGRDKQVIWDYTNVADTAELQTATQLPGGGFMLAVCDGPVRIIELDSLGQQTLEVTYNLGIDVPHAQFRRVIKTSNGNYIMPIITQEKLVEISPAGELVREYTMPQGSLPFSLQELANGNLLVSLGDGHALTEYDRATGQEVKTIAQNDILGVELQFVAQCQRLNSGNTIISNWMGHLENPAACSQKQLIEINPVGEVVWSFDNKPSVKFISAFYPFVQ